MDAVAIQQVVHLNFDQQNLSSSDFSLINSWQQILHN